MERERWKPVVGYEGWYEVSDRGRVKRVKRGHGTQIGRVLKSCPDMSRGGRLRVNLSREGYWKSHSVSHLVAAAFLGEVALYGDVHHIDENPTNDVVSNLKVIPHAAHISGHNRGEDNSKAKLDADAVRGIRMLLAHGWPQWKIGFAYGVDQATVSKIKTGRRWAHVTEIQKRTAQKEVAA